MKKSLDELMSERLPDTGFMVLGERDNYIEVTDTQSGLVWMSASPLQLADFNSLNIEKPFVKMGIGFATMDRAAFRYSPNAPNEPVRQQIIDGHLFINVALPGDRVGPTKPNGPMDISVNKAHDIGFEAGRTLTILSLPEGDFVEVVGDASEDAERVLPKDGSLSQITLEQPWHVSLPTPTRAFFWMGSSMRSFQGPVTLP